MDTSGTGRRADGEEWSTRSRSNALMGQKLLGRRDFGAGWKHVACNLQSCTLLARSEM